MTCANTVYGDGVNHPLMNSADDDPVRHEALVWIDEHPTLCGEPISLHELADRSGITIQSWREGLTVAISDGYVTVLDALELRRVDPGEVGEEQLMRIVPNIQRVQLA